MGPETACGGATLIHGPPLGVGERVDDAPVALLYRDTSVGQGDVDLAAVQPDDQRRCRAAGIPGLARHAAGFVYLPAEIQ
jgi:hypothetical protein